MPGPNGVPSPVHGAAVPLIQPASGLQEEEEAVKAAAAPQGRSKEPGLSGLCDFGLAG